MVDRPGDRRGCLLDQRHGHRWENLVELDELDLILSDPLPSRALEGKGAFRRFKNELYQGHPELISSWHALRDARAQIRAVQWLADEGLIDEDAAQRFKRHHPEPALR